MNHLPKISILITVFLFSNMLYADNNFELISSDINPLWGKGEERRDGLDSRLQESQLGKKRRHFMRPSGPIHKDEAFLTKFQPLINQYLKAGYFPPFFIDKTKMYVTYYQPELEGYYLPYFCNDSLIVLGGDSTLFNYIVEADYDNTEELITQAHRFFNLSDLAESMFFEDTLYDVKAQLHIGTKSAELRGYERSYEIVNHAGDSVIQRGKRIKVIELVVHNH